MTVTLKKISRSFAVIAATAVSLQAQDAGFFPKATPESVGLSADKLATIVDQMERWVEEEKVVGAEILIIKNRQTVLHSMVGWKDREREIP